MFTRLASMFAIAAAAAVMNAPASTLQSMKQLNRVNVASHYKLPSVAEIAVPSLPDIAAVKMLPNKEHVVLYNPALCREAGPVLCEFYRYHEYGHIVLNHINRRDLTHQEKEAEADRWAAQHAPLPCVIAAYRFFSKGHGGSPLHGKSNNRAARMIARLEHPI